MLRVLCCATIVIAIASGMFGADLAAAATIKPDQHFVGLVNDTRHDAVVYTVCPGPAGNVRTGAAAGNQTMSVERARRDHGFTGPFNHVYAWFVPASTSTAKPVELDFTQYRTPQMIPTSVQVPCGGTGRVEFSSCPYLAPCAAGWVPTYVRVQFENIAA